MKIQEQARFDELERRVAELEAIVKPQPAPEEPAPETETETAEE